MNHIDRVRDAFDEYSERYENWYSEAEGKLIKETEKRVAEKMIPKGKGLEVGVGSGIFSSILGVEYGIDPSGKMVRMARSRGNKAVLGIGEMLPFKKESFDYLLFMFTISFLTDPLKVFREVHRVLKPKGKLIICFISRGSPWGEFYRKKKAEGHDFYKHARFHTIGEVEELLEKSQFERTGAYSTLFQEPMSIEKVEDPVKGIRESAGLCCFEAKKC